MDGLQLKGANTSPCPGSKPKPIPKSEHQLILERRLAEEGGSDCIIANLKSEIGRLRTELEQYYKSAKLPQSRTNDDLCTSHQDDVNEVHIHRGKGEGGQGLTDNQDEEELGPKEKGEKGRHR